MDAYIVDDPVPGDYDVTIAFVLSAFLVVFFSAIWTIFAQNLITELDLNFD